MNDTKAATVFIKSEICLYNLQAEFADIHNFQTFCTSTVSKVSFAKHL